MPGASSQGGNLPNGASRVTQNPNNSGSEQGLQFRPNPGAFSTGARPTAPSGVRMFRLQSRTFVLVATLLSADVATAQQFVRQDSIRAVPAPVLLETEGMFQDRYAKVGDDVFIAGQPTERALREMKALGVTTVVNLRSP